MTPEEKRDFMSMQRDMEDIIELQKKFSENQEQNAGKLDQLLSAIQGDKYGNQGIVRRVINVEEEVKVLSKSKTTNDVYIRIITWLLGIITLGVIGFLVNAVLKNI